MELKKFLTVVCCLMAVNIFSANGQNRETDWAAFRRYEEANKQVQVPANVVFMGNSITDAWMRFHPEFFKEHNYLGRGISGQTTAQMLVRFRQDVINLKPRAVVILAGTNDIAKNNGFIKKENILGNLISMAELAQANKIKVIFISILPAYDYSWSKGIEPAQKIVELNRMLKEYCDNNRITYVDCHSAMKDSRDGLPKNLADDGVHPTLEGYKIMEDMVVKAIHKNVKKPYKTAK